jgi:elongation factor 2
MTHVLPVAAIRDLMDTPERIRHVCVVGHVDHGRSMLCDNLIVAHGVRSSEHTRYHDTKADEVERFYARFMSFMLFKAPAEAAPEGASERERTFLINLLTGDDGLRDTRASEQALTDMADGAIIVVDCVEGPVCVMDSVVVGPLADRIRPVLVLNKVDRLILELELGAEEMYQTFQRLIDNVNVSLSATHDPAVGVRCVSPVDGSVTFGSAMAGWGFTLPQFARLYAAKFGVDAATLSKRLWGDSYFDPVTKRWTAEATGSDGATLRRAFCAFCLQPIIQLHRVVFDEDGTKLDKMLAALRITLDADELASSPKRRLKLIMSKWLSMADAVLEMAVTHLPSPKEAQQYRAELLYPGNPTNADRCYAAIRDCDPSGPLMLHICRVVQSGRGAFAFGRVFSGRIRASQKVRIITGGQGGAGGGGVASFDEKKSGATLILLGACPEAVDDVPCGSFVCVAGIDKYIMKTATVTDAGCVDALAMRSYRFTTTMLVSMAIDVVYAVDLPRLTQSLKRFAQADSVVRCYVDETGEWFIAAPSHAQLRDAYDDFKRHFAGNALELKTSVPMVLHCETVANTLARTAAATADDDGAATAGNSTASSPVVSVATTPDRLTRLSGRGSCLAPALCTHIESRLAIGAPTSRVVSPLDLERTHHWDPVDATSIWSYGPDSTFANVLVDGIRRDRSELTDVAKEAIVAGWQWGAGAGPLCAEPLRGVRLDVIDFASGADPAAAPLRSTHVLAAMRALMQECVLAAQPRLLEPVFTLQLRCHSVETWAVYDVVKRLGGNVVTDAALFSISGAHVPNERVVVQLAATQVLALEALLSEAAPSAAVGEGTFAHWQQVGDDPLEAGAAQDAVVAMRRQKGMKAEVPRASLSVVTVHK